MRRINKDWLKALGIEFWLPLPVLALLFWLGCSALTAQVLSRPYGTKDRLQADTQLEAQLLVNISMIQAVINRADGLTHVKVQTINSNLTKLEFAFPVIATDQVEAAIAQELALTQPEVRRLVRYEIID